MKVIATVLSAGVFATILAFGSEGGAQASAQRRPTTITTAGYTEQNVGGDQVVKFTGDELAAPTGGYYGDTVRPLPGVTRLGLIRPRMNFVPELLKSVENF